MHVKPYRVSIGSYLRLFALALLSLTWLPASASFPATNTNNCTVAPCLSYQQSAYAPYTVYSSFAQACTAYAAALSANNANYNAVVVSSTSPNCMTALYTKAGAFVANQGNAGVSIISGSPTYACPSNATMSGTTCTCNSQYSENNGTCQAAWKTTLDSLNASGNTLQYNGTNYQLSVCYNGIVVKGTGTALGIKNGQGMGEVYGPFTSTGAACTGSDPGGSPAPIPCKAGQFAGQVNGVDTCVPASGVATAPVTNTAPPSGSASAPVSGLPGGPAGAVTSSGTTQCANGNCTTTTTYKDGAGSVVGTATKDETQASFCSANPGASICAPAKSECEKNPDTVGCSKYGTPNNDVGLSVQSSGFSAITPVSFLDTSACPAAVPFAVFGNTYSISYSGICGTLTDYVKPIILLLAAASAAFIFTKSFKV